MKQLIQNYADSCVLVKTRISELTALRNEKKKQGSLSISEERDLNKRIRLLYTEHGQMKDIIIHLTAYLRMVEQRADT